MFQLLPREQALIVFILVATLLGTAVKHWRDVHRHPAVVQAPASAARPPEPPLAGRLPAR